MVIVNCNLRDSMYSVINTSLKLQYKLIWKRNTEKVDDEGWSNGHE